MCLHQEIQLQANTQAKHTYFFNQTHFSMPVSPGSPIPHPTPAQDGYSRMGAAQHPALLRQSTGRHEQRQVKPAYCISCKFERLISLLFAWFQLAKVSQSLQGLGGAQGENKEHIRSASTYLKICCLMLNICYEDIYTHTHIFSIQLDPQLQNY